MEIDLFIDDSMENFNECNDLSNTECIIFGNYAWNQTNDEDIRRANNWNDVSNFVR